MKRRIFTLLYSLFLICVLGSLEQVYACSCMSPSSPCVALGNAEAVFIGTAVGSKEQITYDGVTYDVGEIYFEVSEGFSGVKKGSKVTISSGTGGGDCGYWFRRGETYVVYAYGDEKDGYSTSICTRTKLVSAANEDLEFLRKLPDQGDGVRIFGTVHKPVKDPYKKGWRQYEPLPGINLTIQQEDGERRKFEVVSDGNGKFEVKNVRSGKYTIVPAVPKNTIVDEYGTKEFHVADRGCAERTFLIENDSLIAGRVIDSDGKPVNGVWVELFPAATIGRPSEQGDDSDITYEEGRFKFENIPEGIYILSVNYIHAPNDDAPFPTTFYPGTLERAGAFILELGRGGKFDNLEFRLPVRTSVQTVQGTIKWSDGTPAANVSVHLEDTDRLGWCVNGCSSETDDKGNFTLKAYAGKSYRLRASGEKVKNGTEQTFYAEMPVFTADGEIPVFHLVLNLTEDPTGQD